MNENEVVAEPASNQAEIEAERRIEERWEAAFDGMDEKTAREWAKLDMEDFGKIQDKELARFAAVTITSNMENSVYKVEFERGGEEMLARVTVRAISLCKKFAVALQRPPTEPRSIDRV